MAQLEAGKDVIEFASNEKILQIITEHTGAAQRYGLLLDYMEGLKSGAIEPKLLVGARPEELRT